MNPCGVVHVSVRAGDGHSRETHHDGAPRLCVILRILLLLEDLVYFIPPDALPRDCSHPFIVRLASPSCRGPIQSLRAHHPSPSHNQPHCLNAPLPEPAEHSPPLPPIHPSAILPLAASVSTSASSVAPERLDNRWACSSGSTYAPPS